MTFAGVTILFNKPKKKDPALFSFLSPLSFTVWIYMISAYIGVSMFLYLLAKISPYEKGNFSFLEPGPPPPPVTAGPAAANGPREGDARGLRLARSDPIYDTLAYNGNGRVRTGCGSGPKDEVDGGGGKVESTGGGPEDFDDSQTFTLLNSFWFVIASLLQQGIDVLPR